MGSLLQETPYSEITATVEALAAHGVARGHFCRIRTDAGLAERVALFIRRRGNPAALTDQVAREILGPRFFGVEAWAEHFDAPLHPDDLPEVEDCFPWGREVLEAPCPFTPGKRIAETHLGFLAIQELRGVELTIAHMRGLLSQFQSAFGPDPATGRYSILGNKVVGKVCDFRYYLMPVLPPPALQGESLHVQIALLPPEYEVASAVAEVLKRQLCRTIGVQPADGAAGTARCEDEAARVGSCVVVVGYDQIFFRVHDDPLQPAEGCSLAVSRKLPEL